MKSVEVTLYTTANIKERHIADNLLSLLESIALVPEKVGQTEPLRELYSRDRAADLWAHEDDGCYVDGKGMVGKTGGIIAKSRRPNFFVQSTWWDCPDRLNLSWVTVDIAERDFKKYSTEVLIFFEKAIELLHACYGYVAPDTTVYRQHVSGRLDTRMPGVFWFNYFGQPYVEFFTKEKITAYPWHSIQETKAGGLFISLVDDYTIVLESDEYENKAKSFLGSSSFGNVEEYLKNPRKIQIRDVPRL